MPPQRMTIPVDDPSWLPRHRDALMLANLLRVSRLTLLHGEAGAGKSALLKNELLALLRRRATDVAPRPPSSQARVVVPFPDRRNGGRLAANGEVAVFFDEWGDDDPLAGLLARVEAELGTPAPDTAAPLGPWDPMSLAETLLRLGQRHDTRLLVILDGFEAHLTADPEATGTRRFADALTQVLNHPAVPAHFFIVVRDDAQPLLDPWRSRVPGFGDRWLRIRHWSSLLPQPTERPGDDDDQSASAPARPKPPALVRSTAPAETAPVATVAVDKTPPPERHPGLELGIDLYLPLPPQTSRPPSERVQALWDQLLSRPIAHRPPATAAATTPGTADPALEIPLTDTLPLPEPAAAASLPLEPVAAEPPAPRRTPWMAWSLAVIAVAALMIYAWGDSLQDKPPTQQPPIASGVEPARGP